MCAHPRGPFTCEIHVISIRKTHSRPLRSFGQNSDHETLKVGANLILYSSKIWEGDIWQLLLDFDCRVPRSGRDIRIRTLVVTVSYLWRVEAEGRDLRSWMS